MPANATKAPPEWARAAESPADERANVSIVHTRHGRFVAEVRHTPGHPKGNAHVRFTHEQDSPGGARGVDVLDEQHAPTVAEARRVKAGRVKQWEAGAKSDGSYLRTQHGRHAPDVALSRAESPAGEGWQVNEDGSPTLTQTYRVNGIDPGDTRIELSSEGGGHWVTLQGGEHVMIGGGGVITKGPANLTGRNVANLPPPPWAGGKDEPHPAAQTAAKIQQHLKAAHDAATPKEAAGHVAKAKAALDEHVKTHIAPAAGAKANAASAADPRQVAAAVKEFNDIKDSVSSLSVADIRQRFSSFRTLDKPTLEAVSKEIGFGFKGPKGQVADRLQSSLESHKGSQIRQAAIDGGKYEQPTGGDNTPRDFGKKAAAAGTSSPAPKPVDAAKVDAAVAKHAEVSQTLKSGGKASTSAAAHFGTLDKEHLNALAERVGLKSSPTKAEALRNLSGNLKEQAAAGKATGAAAKASAKASAKGSAKGSGGGAKPVDSAAGQTPAAKATAAKIEAHAEAVAKGNAGQEDTQKLLADVGRLSKPELQSALNQSGVVSGRITSKAEGVRKLAQHLDFMHEISDRAESIRSGSGRSLLS